MYGNRLAVLGAKHTAVYAVGSLAKEDSRTTVVWNPWIEGARSFTDLGDEEWREMACVEACNIRAFAVDLPPGQQHTLKTTIRVSPA